MAAGAPALTTQGADHLEAPLVALDGGLDINDVPIRLTPVFQEISLPPGQSGLSTMRLSLLLRGQLDGATGPGEQRLDYRDDSYSQRLGWKEIIARPGGGISLVDSTVPQQDRSDQLRSYPKNLLDSPSDDTEARATFVLAALGVVGGLVPSVSALVILLAAISWHRVRFGLLPILAFSGVMAVVLTGIGLPLVYTRRLLEHIPLKNPLVVGLARLLPLGAALIVLLSGMAITVRAMFQVGVL